LGGFEEPVIGTVDGVVLQHIEDETFLDGLAHTVFVKRLGLAVGVALAEDFDGLVLGRRREGEEAEIRLLFAPFHNADHFLFVIG